MHFVLRRCELPSLAMVEVTADPKAVPVGDNLEEVFRLSGSVALEIHLTSHQVWQHIDLLRGRNLLLDIRCAGRAAADIRRWVRQHSRPL